MRTKSKVLIRKFSSLLKMNSLFYDRHWPAYVLTTLEKKYQLSPKEMLRLWYIRRRISNGKYPVDSLLIYDRIKASEKRILVRSSRDLSSNSDLLLFKGNIFGDGSVHLERVNN
jgi:hypothetical protein